MFRKLNFLGFSLIEMMIVLVVMSIAMLGLGQFAISNMRATKSLELTGQLDQMMIELQLTLNNPVTCATNIPFFSTSVFDPTTTKSIAISKVNSLTGTVLTSGTALPNSAGNSANISLENFNQVGPTSYTADLVVTLDKGTNITGGSLIKRRTVLSLATSGVAPTVTISGCNSVSTAAAAVGAISPPVVCALFGGIYDPVSGLCTGTTVGPSGGGAGAGGGTCPATTVYCMMGPSGVTMPIPSKGVGIYNSAGPIGAYTCAITGVCSSSLTWTSLNCACR